MSFSFLSLFLCLAFLQVQARDSMFFNKFTRSTAPAPVMTPPVATDSGLRLAPKSSHGHFGPGSGMVVQTQESWPTPSTPSQVDKEFEELMEKFDREDDGDDWRDGDNRRDVDSYGNQKPYRNEYKNHNYGYTQRRQGMSDTRFFPTKYSSDIKPDFPPHKNHGSERQGMVDARFAEKGNYNSEGYFDKDKYFNNNAYDNTRHKMSDTRFMDNDRFYNGEPRYGYEKGGRRRGGSGYGGANNLHPNEFDTMQEYYRSLEKPEYEP